MTDNPHTRHGSATEEAAGSFLDPNGRVILGKMRWRTPPDVVERIARSLGLADGFDLDAAAEDDWHHGKRWFTAADDCLTRDWRTMGREPRGEPINASAFLNPPWGAKGLSDKVREIAATLTPAGRIAELAAFPGTAAFVEHAWAQSRLGMTVAVLVPQAFDAAWMRALIPLADEIRVGTRIRFLDYTGKPGPQPPGGHALLVFRPYVPEHGWPGGPRVDWSWTP